MRRSWFDSKSRDIFLKRKDDFRMFQCSLEQLTAALVVCCFLLGVVCDRAFAFFADHYVLCDEEDDTLVCDPDYTVS